MSLYSRSLCRVRARPLGAGLYALGAPSRLRRLGRSVTIPRALAREAAIAKYSLTESAEYLFHRNRQRIAILNTYFGRLQHRARYYNGTILLNITFRRNKHLKITYFFRLLTPQFY